MLTQLDEVLNRIAKLPPSELKELEKAHESLRAKQSWVPNPGPQTDAYYSEADELLFGGEAGGGKSDLLIGLSLISHNRSLIMRRTNKESEKLVERYAEIIGNRDGYNGQEKTWRIPGQDRIIDIAGCQHEHDKQKWKGIPHSLKCVGKGTPVLMADGTHKPVETVTAGMFVMTLEGPKRVDRVLPVQVKPCVSVRAKDHLGRVVAEQIQSTTHAIMFENAWASPVFACASMQDRDDSGTAGSFSRILLSVSRSLSEKLSRLRCIYESLRLFAGHRAGLVRTSFLAPQVQGICYAASDGSHVEISRPPLSSSRAAPQKQNFLTGVRDFFRPSMRREAFGVRALSLLVDSRSHCSSGTHPCDERIQKRPGLSIGSVASPQSSLLLADVAKPSPNHWRADDSGKIQGCTRLEKHTYAHPYGKGKRPISESFSLRIAAWDYSYVGEQEVYDLQIAEVNHYITDNGFINKNCFDELVDFSESQYMFIITWNRSTNQDERCRIVATTNPPTRPEGMWVVRRWAAWLDPKHPHPAKPGELRWYTTGEDGKEHEVNGRGPHIVNGREVYAKSRTFIRSRLSDNPDLARTDYAARLDSLPEELRLAYREGKFDASIKDAPFQCVPTDWIRAAMERWTERPRQGVPMCAMGVDASGGGQDPMMIAIRYDGWYAPLIEVPAKEIPMDRIGKVSAGHVISHRRDKALVVVDMGGGYGGPILEHLRDNDIDTTPFKGAESSVKRTSDKQLRFFNKRTEAYWKFREALDPSQVNGSPIFLPDDQMLLSELAAPTFEVTPNGIKLETKEDVMERLGHSPDRADAVVMAWFGGPNYITDGNIWRAKASKQGQYPNKAIMGRHHARRR